MANKPRTFTVKKQPMKGEDVKLWQHDIKKMFKNRFKIDCPIVVDGVFGKRTWDYTAALVHSEGLSAGKQLDQGVTPRLRDLLRDSDFTAAQKKTRDSKARKDYRAGLKKRWSPAKVCKPVTKILQDSWGYHPGVHDGLDVITDGGVPTFAMVKCRVIDVRSGGWWGLGAPSDPKVRAKGDGIVQMEVLESVGPFKKGMHIGYGHNENAVVKVGQILEAGDHVAYAGFANAWHIHLMVNNGSTTKGVGNIDPKPLVDYTVKNG